MIKTQYFSQKRRGLSFTGKACRLLLAGVTALAGMANLSSCSQYDLDERTPDNWGASIYSYLVDNGNYTNFSKIIDDLGYRSVLDKTGSKTLFAADDDAFKRFYANNKWGVHSYADLTVAQKRMLLFGAMINNSYQLNYLCNTEGNVKGVAMRRLSALSPYDSVPKLTPDEMPDNKYWRHLKTQPYVYCFKDLTYTPMIHFMENFLVNNKITNEDYDFLYNHTTNRQAGQASVNGLQVVEEDIRCSNGFIDRTEEVMTPLDNMAEIIKGKPQMSQWNSLLERFCAPDSSEEASIKLGLNWPTEKAYQKRFFSEWSQGGKSYNASADGSVIDPAELLSFDPGWNQFYSGTNTTPDVELQRNMGLMLVPTNEALEEYWNNGEGKVLSERYGTWDKVPNNVVAELINNNMQKYLISCVPSKFPTMLNKSNDPMNISESDVDSVFLGNNGAIYMTNKVFAPTSFVSVMFPVIVFNDNYKILWSIINSGRYDALLNSLTSTYSLFVPSSKAVLQYVDPCSYAKSELEMLRFHWNNATKEPYASVHKYDPATGVVGDSIGVKSGTWSLNRRLEFLLKDHIVVGDVTDGHTYYRTMGNSIIRVNNPGKGKDGMTVEGTYQMNDDGKKIPVTNVYNQQNGHTYIIDEEPILGTRQSVKDIIDATPEFEEFGRLLEASGIIENNYKEKTCGDNYINAFNSYQYTVYVPTNESIRQLISSGQLIDPDVYEQMKESGADVTADSTRLVNFVKYHIQDNALIIGASNSSSNYETAMIDEATKGFARLNVTADDNNITIQDKQGNVRHVLKTDKNLYNRFAREYIYPGKDAKDASNIETNSSAVVHLIDGPLLFWNKQGAHAKKRARRH